MKIIVLVENTTCHQNYQAKHGLSIYIETAQHKILFDLGADNLFHENAKKMNIDIGDVDTVVISHGHKDHGGALAYFLKMNTQAKIYIHEEAFGDYYAKVLGIPFYIGLDKSLKSNERIVFINDEMMIDNELYLFSNVSHKDFTPKSNNSLYMKSQDDFVLDDFKHEHNLLISEGSSYVLFGGCSHNGIVNVEKKLYENKHIKATHVFSGFHIYNPVTKQSENKGFIEELAKTLSQSSAQYYTCHCTGLKPFKNLKYLLGGQIDYIATGTQLYIKS